LPKGEEAEIRTEADYRTGIRRLFRGYWNGSFSMFEFLDNGQSVIGRGYRQAWHEGAAREGVRPDELTHVELGEINSAINAEVGNLLMAATDLQGKLKTDGGKWGPIQKRADTWASRYEQIAARAELTAAGDKKKKWTYGDTEHCEDCRKLNGRVYRASKWREANIEPRSSRLQCFGIHCQCRFEDTDEPITRGKIPRLRGPRSDHQHEAPEVEAEIFPSASKSDILS
jgi:hypothetical protein